MADVSFYCSQCGRNLQADARSAGMQVQCPQCGNVTVVPHGVASPVGPLPASGRPTSVTVFGVLGIVFGGLALLCTPFGLIGTFATPDVLNPSPVYKAWLIISSGLGLVMAGWLLAVGIGLLGLKRWARSGAIFYGWFAIVIGILSMIGNVAALALGAVSPGPGALPGYIGGTIGGLIGLVYPILLLVFMSKPHVIAACSR